MSDLTDPAPTRRRLPRPRWDPLWRYVVAGLAVLVAFVVVLAATVRPGMPWALLSLLVAAPLVFAAAWIGLGGRYQGRHR